jgi:FkbM family methyltransferase
VTVRSLARRVVPRRIRGQARLVPMYPEILRVAAGPRSFVRLCRLLSPSARWRPQDHDILIRVRALRGQALRLRPGTADAWALMDTFSGRYHRPPGWLRAREVDLIWDLGANIGTTMADLAERFPRARVTGVEIDPGNARLCGVNLHAWYERCHVLRGAVWPEEGRIAFVSERGEELSPHVIRPGEPDNGWPTSPCVTLDGLAAELADGEQVGFVKMDIEGAEREVLRRATGWTSRVRCLKVEVHEPYRVEECVADLRALGFRTLVDDRHHAAVLAWRPELG